MKVVLFCGGLGMRIRDYAEAVPKPMVPLGYRPLIWHVMKYYAHYGHKDFILCLGYRGDTLKQFFLNYEECLSNDFVLAKGGRERKLLSSDIEDWKVTFVETGLKANIGERLLAVRPHLEGEEWFLANYADGLTDLDLHAHIQFARTRDSVATMLAVRPNLSYHFVSSDRRGFVKSFHGIARSGLRVNGGYFVFKRDIFDYICPGEDISEEPFRRLIRAAQLVCNPFDGFWMPMDTAKDKQVLDDLHATGNPPWYVWRKPSVSASLGAAFASDVELLPRA